MENNKNEEKIFEIVLINDEDTTSAKLADTPCGVDCFIDYISCDGKASDDCSINFA